MPHPQETKRVRRILVVDDDPDIRLLNKRTLTKSGYLVDAVEDGDAAWEALQLGTYDLLLTDNNMSRLTGLGLIQKLHLARIPVPVILATGSVPLEEIKRQPWLQIKATLEKPFSLVQLLSTVRTVLGLQEPAQDANLQSRSLSGSPTL